MGEFTKISWSHGTFNPWWGCAEIEGDPACEFCYARRLSEQYGFVAGGAHFPIWGAHEQRRFFKQKHFDELLKWNASALAEGVRKRIFIASMADWAEGRPDQREALDQTWDMCRRTPMLDKLMLTKRPQLINKLMPAEFRPHPTIWQGVTAVTQAWLNLRLEALRDVEASVYWISAEPLMERLTIPWWFKDLGSRGWVIVGGESGPRDRIRYMNPEWPRDLREQCRDSGNRFHMKQMTGATKKERESIPEDLMIRECPEPIPVAEKQ